MKHFRLLTLLLLCCGAASAQLPMGTWRTHFSYGVVEQIANAHDQVYALSNGALFAVSKEYGSLQFYSKIEGLNDLKIANIAYNERYKALMIVYENANIDLLFDDGSVENIPDIGQKSLTYSKRVNDIYFSGDLAYLSADFGIVVVNLARREVKETYFVGENGGAVAVQALCTWQGRHYAITSADLLSADTSSLLVNYANWHTDTTATVAAKRDLFTFDNKLWLLSADSTLYSNAGSGWQAHTELGKVGEARISAGMLLLKHSYNTIRSYNTQLEAQTIATLNARDMLYDGAKRTYWIAESRNVRSLNTTTHQVAIYAPNGPLLKYDYAMRCIGTRLYVLPGSRWTDYSRPGYLMTYEDGEWSYVAPAAMKATPANTTSLKELYPQGLVDMAVDPADATHFFIASWGLGVYEFRNNTFHQLINADNSALESALPDKYPGSGFYYYTRVGAVTYDANGVLWMTNELSAQPIKYRLSNGNTYAYHSPEIAANNSTQALLASNQNTNQKWVLISRGSGYLYVFDDGGTPALPTDDKRRRFNEFTDQDGKVSTPTFAWCMAQDHDGDVWIGTTAGIIVAPNTSAVFEPNYRFKKIKIPRNDGTNEADYLLDNENINAIVVDAVNRKWIATSASGVYLVSADGTETIEHFTTDNSPLLSNTVLSIAINGVTGEVFFGTDNGIISYQGDASDAHDDFNTLRAYPNPVREDFRGKITFTGLVANTTIKVLDMAGTLVYSTTSNGGTATWDGCRIGGERVSTGVYFVLCTTPDKKVHSRTKLLVVK